MISVVLVPIIKNNSRKINSKDNYRPIAIASIMSKLIEKVLLERLSNFLKPVLINLVLNQNTVLMPVFMF